MTQLRAPKTFAEATTRVAGVIGWDHAAAIVGRTERTVRYWSQDDCTTTPTLAQAIALDTAYRANGGQGAPFLDAYAFLIGVQIDEQQACRRELAAELGVAARESGDALQQSILITTGNASPLETMRAFAEVDQAYTAWGAVMRRIKRFLPAGTGSAADHAGGGR